MTLASDILRRAGDALLRASPWPARLAILEDRRRLKLLQRARPSVPLCLASAINAYRPLCPRLDDEAFDHDARALEGSELSLVMDWLDASGICDSEKDAWLAHAEARCDLHATEDNWFTSRVFFCGLHEVWYSRRTQAHEVVVRWRNGIRDTETWCNDAVDDAAFYCDGSQAYYCSAAFDAGRTVDGDTVCETWAELHGYWSDDDGHWRNDDPDDDDDCAIPGYHHADRVWSLATARQACIAFYGLEIELCFDDEHERLGFYEEVGFPTADLTAERDGSLDEDEGLEIITRPFTLTELRAPRNPLAKAMDWAQDYGAADPSPSGYGVHVTTNAQRLTRDHRRRLVDATYDMRALTEFVAGRKCNHDYYSYNKAGRQAEKYTAINERSDGSFEFRVFRGTADWQVLLSYVEYVDALTEWTRNPANPTRGPIGQALFRAWIRVTGHYPALSRRFTTTLTQEALACALPSLSRAA